MATIQREVFQKVQGGQMMTGSTTLKTTEKTTEKILNLLRRHPSITNQEMAEKIGLSVDGIYYHTKKLKENGIIRRIGPDKGGYWEVIE